MHILVARWPVVVGSLLLSASLSSSAQTLLSFSNAVERAEAHSAELEASRQAVLAARESAVAAGQLPDPQLRAGLDNVPVNGADRFSTTRDSMTMRRVGLAQEIVPAITRAARRTVGLRMAEREEAEARAARATVRKEAASAWLDANIAARALTLPEALQVEARLQLSTFDSQVRAAKASSADFAALQAAALQVDDRVLAARAELDLALLALARWVGEDVRVVPGGMPDFTALPKARESYVSRNAAAARRSPATGARAGRTRAVPAEQAAELEQVAPGTTLFRIADLDAVWVYAEVPEAQAGNVAPGAHAEVRVTAYPGKVLKGTLSAILPEVAQATRTLRARLEIENPGLLLKPEMFVRVSLLGASNAPVLVVPQEAVIATGTRTVVVVASDDGRYIPVDVVLGRFAGGDVEVESGLSEGQKVVTSGQFLLDSEASLDPAMLNAVKTGDKVKFSADIIKGKPTVTRLESVR